MLLALHRIHGRQYSEQSPLVNFEDHETDEPTGDDHRIIFLDPTLPHVARQPLGHVRDYAGRTVLVEHPSQLGLTFRFTGYKAINGEDAALYIQLPMFETTV